MTLELSIPKSVVHVPGDGIDLRRVMQRANILANIRASLASEGYIEIEVPELVVSTGACEEMDSVYHIDMFGDLAFLRQTGQLYLEEVVIRGLDKAYCDGQSFRKEPASGDGRHLCEFRLIEIEKRDMDLDDLIDAEVAMMRSIIAHLDPMIFPASQLERLNDEFDGEIPRVTYREAVQVLNRMGDEIRFGDDMSRFHEQKLVHAFGKGALAITHHPTDIKFFNMLVNPEDPTVCDSCDLILRDAGETFGSSVRDTDADSMRDRLHSKPMYHHMMERAESFAEECAHRYHYTDEQRRAEALRIRERIDQSFNEYFTLIRSNPVPRAGYGLGVARLLQYIQGTDSIDQAVTFPVTRRSFR